MVQKNHATKREHFGLKILYASLIRSNPPDRFRYNAGVSAAASNEGVIADTMAWLVKDVIGLNLCPFAEEVHVSNRIRYAVSGALTTDALRADLVDELLLLKSLDAAKTDTTLLIHPQVLGDFLDYNDFLDVADETIRDLGLIKEFQIASFHPCYQFAGTKPGEVTNRSNRSPYPTLHLLREASVASALANYPDADKISERNIETLRRLGSSASGNGRPPGKG